MITDFRLLIRDARLSMDLPSDQIHLIKMFMTCLNPQLKKISETSSRRLLKIGT